MKTFPFVGVDFGSKMAGTTAIAYYDGGTVVLEQSTKGKSADNFLEELLQKLNIEGVFIDAPLSLPHAYFEKGNDFFFRQCDKELKAMSPMFLGGLTARAMKLSQSLDFDFFEAYPGALAEELGLKDFGYKKEKIHLPDCQKIVTDTFDIELHQLTNWHQFDALLAFCTGIRWSEKKCRIIGNKSEGLIYV